jgi:hypothetical protein
VDVHLGLLDDPRYARIREVRDARDALPAEARAMSRS